MRVMFRAYESTRLMNFQFVTCAHFLIALQGDEHSIANAVLEHHGLTLPALKPYIKPLMVSDEKLPAGDVSLGPAGSRILKVALRESHSLQSVLHTGHLLFALLNEPDLLEKVFTPLGIEATEIKELLLEMTQDSAAIQAEDQPVSERSIAKAISERFSDEISLVLMLADKETRRVGHSFIGIEHILLGLLDYHASRAKPSKRASDVLKSLRKKASSQISLGYGWVPRHLQFTSSALRLLEKSHELCDSQGIFAIEIEHLKYALGSEDTYANEILEKLKNIPGLEK